MEQINKRIGSTTNPFEAIVLKSVCKASTMNA